MKVCRGLTDLVRVGELFPAPCSKPGIYHRELGTAEAQSAVELLHLLGLRTGAAL